MKVLDSAERFQLFTTPILGILFFLLFAYDIENDKDVYTWFWLLSSIIYFLIYITILFRIVIKKLNHVEDQTNRK